MKRNILYYCAVVMIMSIPAYAALESDQLPTSKAYTDAQLDTVQDAFAGLGANKLMTYPTTAGGTPGSRDIITTLGTPNASGDYTNTTDTTIATRGAINTGLSNKQDTLHGTSGYAVLGTGTAGTLSEKAIYGTGTQFEGALIETGTLNQAVIDAVNSELILVNENGQSDNNGTLWKIADSLTLLATTSNSGGGGSGSGGTSAIAKALALLLTDQGYDGSISKVPQDGGVNPSNAICPDAVYNQMSMWDECQRMDGYDETNNAYVEGTVVTRGACSTVTSSNEGDIPANQSQIDSDYASGMAGNSVGTNCYCKFTKVFDNQNNGYDLISPWVYVGTASYGCGEDGYQGCSSQCNYYGWDSSILRDAIQ